MGAVLEGLPLRSDYLEIGVEVFHRECSINKTVDDRPVRSLTPTSP